MVSYPDGFNDQSYAAACLDAGIIIYPGGFFADHCTDWFRLVGSESHGLPKALVRWPSLPA